MIGIWANYGIVSGYNGKFKPDENITRGDMAVIVIQIMQYQVEGSNVYSDLTNNQYYKQISPKIKYC